MNDAMIPKGEAVRVKQRPLHPRAYVNHVIQIASPTCKHSTITRPKKGQSPKSIEIKENVPQMSLTMQLLLDCKRNDLARFAKHISFIGRNGSMI